MESLCSVGRSTKKGKRQQGFIGEKGNPIPRRLFESNSSFLELSLLCPLDLGLPIKSCISLCLFYFVSINPNWDFGFC